MRNSCDGNKKQPQTITAVTWLTYLLIFGVTFCLVDVIYIFQFLDENYSLNVKTDFMKKKNKIIEGIIKQLEEQEEAEIQEREEANETDEPVKEEDIQDMPQEQKQGQKPGKGNKQKQQQKKKPKAKQNKKQGQENAQNGKKLEIKDDKNVKDEVEREEIEIQDLLKEDRQYHDGEKSNILSIIKDAGFKALDRETYESLPTWGDVTDLYGHEPRFVGLPEQCEQFQHHNGDPADHFVSVAGTFNTGTNLMAELLINNCHMPARMEKYGSKNRGIRWQVNWGKHTPPEDDEFRKTHKVYHDDMEANKILPAVTIRDPYVWLQSMCRHPYTAKWLHDQKRHCPNLVPDKDDLRQFPELLNYMDYVPVTVTYNGFSKSHSSLVHMYNEYYNAYRKNENSFNRIFVRYEDLLFYTENVTRTVCECAGGEMNIDKKQKHFTYIVESAKRGENAHGPMSKRIGFITALIKYGSAKLRYDGFEQEDINYVMEHIDPQLMELFGYINPSQ